MSRTGQTLLFVGIFFLVIGAIAALATSGASYPFVWVLLALGGIGFLVGIFLDVRFWGQLFGQRATRAGLSLGTLILITLGIVAVVDYFAFKHNKKFDFTKEKLFTLAPQSKELAKGLTDDLNIVGFFDDKRQDVAGDKAKFQDLISQYQAETSKIKVRYVNPVKRPDEAKAYDVNMASVAVLEYKGKKNKLEEYTEQAFTNALIKLKRDKNKIVYFVTGHGELNTEGNEQDGASNFKKYLGDASYEVKKLNFLEKSDIPADADALVIAGPKQAYLDKEIGLLKDYLVKGGKLVIAIDPGTKTNLGSLTSELGIDFKNNYILDLNGERVGAGPATAVGLKFSANSDITKSFTTQGQAVVIFHIASQLKVNPKKPAGFNVDEIVKSSEYSFTKPDLKTGEVRFDQGKDEKGPLTVAASVTGHMKDATTGKDSDKEFQVVVFGDSDFLSNRMIDALLNHDLAMNTVAALAKDMDQINIRPKSSEGTQLQLTHTHIVLLWAVILGIPLLIFATGGVVYFRRRAA